MSIVLMLQMGQGLPGWIIFIYPTSPKIKLNGFPGYQNSFKHFFLYWDLLIKFENYDLQYHSIEKFFLSKYNY